MFELLVENALQLNLFILRAKKKYFTLELLSSESNFQMYVNGHLKDRHSVYQLFTKQQFYLNVFN